MPSPQAEALKDVFRQLRDSMGEGVPTIEAQRAGGEAFGQLTAEPAGVSYTPVQVGLTPGQWIDPVGAARDRVVLYAHGGGYAACSVESHKKMVGHLATAAGSRALSIDYRLAPEHPHPAPVEDMTAAYRWLLDQGYEPSRLAVAGDSAGGGLAVATMVKLRDDGVPLPAAAVVFSPWVDMEGLGESQQTRADHDLLVSATASRAGAANFLQGHDPRDPLAAPLHADLTGLPPLYIQVGDHEVLLDDSTRLAAKAEQAGVDVRLDVFPEMLHVFQVCAGNMPEADDALTRAGAWLVTRLAPAQAVR